MLQSIVNPKVIHKAMQAIVDPYEVALDSGMDFIEPETPEYFGSNLGCLEQSAVPKWMGLARSEKKFGIQVIGVLEKARVNGYYRCKLLCLDGSELEDDVSPDELKALPEFRKGSAFAEWVGGKYPVEPIIESALYVTENKDKLSSCVLCGRTLTHPLSVNRHIGPECYKRITPYGYTFVEGDEVSQRLLGASQVYSEERFQKWIIRAVLTLNAALPETTLEWLGNEYFGYSNKPSLYYLDANNKLNCIEIKKKHMAHRRITSLSTCENDADYRAWGMVHGKEELIYREVEAEDLGPYLKGQWLFFEQDGGRPSVYLEKNNHLWCNCHQLECKHIKKVLEIRGTSG